MTPTEADLLGKRIINCWRGGPPLAEWVEELTPLELGQAGTTYARLKRQLEHAPSIARFMAEYRTLDTHDASTRPVPCGWCSDGWVETRPHEFRGWVYSGVEPCPHCAEGRARAGSRVWAGAGERRFVSEQEAVRLVASHKENPT